MPILYSVKKEAQKEKTYEKKRILIEQLEAGKTLSWTYMGTPYEKMINQNGIATEYVRCPDLSENSVVVKITRTNKL